MRSVSSIPAAGSGPTGGSTVSAVARTARAMACGTSPGRATPAAASRPYRITWISQSSPLRRAATISGQAARLRTRWKRAPVLIRVSSRLRIVAASSNRCSAASRCNRSRSPRTAGRTSSASAERTCSTRSP